MSFCDYVNVFQGCGEIDLPEPEGISRKWFFLKAGCGNTSPAACVPFGAMSVAPYSGGYPTGYGNHLPNSHSRPAKFEEGKSLLGFAHLQQSGTGAIGYYYNYALVTPRYEGSAERREPKDEKASPGYYSCSLENIRCELTASRTVAFHRYTFGSQDGFAVVDFSNNGLNCAGAHRGTVSNLSVAQISPGVVTARAEIEGINVYFAAESSCDCCVANNNAIFFADRGTLVLRVAVSLRSEDEALCRVFHAPRFDDAVNNAARVWEETLSAIEIETSDEKIREIFYSNLYHSLIKPSDFRGESFIYRSGPFMTDLATLWDMYKTALPLIFMICPSQGKDICETLMNLGEALGYIPNSIGHTADYSAHSGQARTLGSYVLMTGYRLGIPMDAHRMLKVIESDILSEYEKDNSGGEYESSSLSRTLDLTECAALAAEIAAEECEFEIREKLLPIAAKSFDCYSPETGLLRSDSDYYEGSLWNYSFRQMADMDRRIGIAGGRDKFVALMDKFFGYGAKDTVQPTDPFNYEPVKKGLALGRFEGFNNESDTEAPFSYIYAGRHDRTCEIIRSGMKCMFTTGRGGLPGNNDSGALSSYYVMMALGLFPVAGQNLFLIGSPFVDRAKITLSSGRILEIEVKGNSPENIYVEKVSFGGKELTGYRIEATELMRGGKLEFTMKGKENET